MFHKTLCMYMMLTLQYIETKYSDFKTDETFNFTLENLSEYIELKFDDADQKKPITGWTVQPHSTPCQVNNLATLCMHDQHCNF